jgi:hypothetical protein
MRYFCSWSVRPWNFSGSGRSDLESRRISLALHRQFVGLGAEQDADGTDDVADVPALEGGVGFLADLVARDVDLDAAANVRNGDERRLAHHALQHDAAGDLDFDRVGFEFLAVFAS